MKRCEKGWIVWSFGGYGYDLRLFFDGRTWLPSPDKAKVFKSLQEARRVAESHRGVTVWTKQRLEMEQIKKALTE